MGEWVSISVLKQQIIMKNNFQKCHKASKFVKIIIILSDCRMVVRHCNLGRIAMIAHNTVLSSPTSVVHRVMLLLTGCTSCDTKSSIDTPWCSRQQIRFTYLFFIIPSSHHHYHLRFCRTTTTFTLASDDDNVSEWERNKKFKLMSFTFFLCYRGHV